MFKILYLFLCLTVTLLFPFVSSHLEAQTTINGSPPITLATMDGESKSGNVAEELSSAITPPTGPPASIIGTAVAFNAVWVDVAVNPPAWVGNTYVCSSSLNWGGIFPSGASGFTTCTITLSSVPPGPCTIYLNGSATSNQVWVDSQVTVITSATNPTWFQHGTNVNPSTIFSVASLEPQLGWWSQTAGSKSDDIVLYASPYPTLQYAPNSLTIVYQ